MSKDTDKMSAPAGLISNACKNKGMVEIWVDDESNIIADLAVDNSFLLKRSTLSLILYSIALVFSGGVMTLSTILIVKTKGWGTYELMEKHKKN